MKVYNYKLWITPGKQSLQAQFIRTVQETKNSPWVLITCPPDLLWEGDPIRNMPKVGQQAKESLAVFNIATTGDMTNKTDEEPTDMLPCINRMSIDTLKTWCGILSELGVCPRQKS